MADLSHTMLCAEHILIAYKSSARYSGNMHLAGPPSERSQKQALALAVELRGRLERNPGAFGELARKNSDDVTTRDSLGGVLGCGAANYFPDAVIDALGNLEYGAVSGVVPSKLGYHLVRRMHEPAEQVVAARVIVILHRDVREVVFSQHPAAAKRSREEASELASRVRELALAHPEKFSSLADEFSDELQNAGGDYGAWSTRDLNAEPPVIALLTALPVGAISMIVEDFSHGFRFFERTAATARKVYAHCAITVRHEPSADATRQARAAAERILVEAVGNPRLFDERPARYCDTGDCIGPFTYTAGRAGVPNLARYLEQVKVGQVVPTVVETMGAFEVVRREVPSRDDSLATAFTLPRPARKTIKTASAAEFAMYLDAYAATVKRETKLTGDQFATFTRIITELKGAIVSAPRQEWDGLVEDARRRTIAQLGLQLAKELNDIDAALQLRLQGQLPSAAK